MCACVFVLRGDQTQRRVPGAMKSGGVKGIRKRQFQKVVPGAMASAEAAPELWEPTLFVDAQRTASEDVGVKRKQCIK